MNEGKIDICGRIIRLRKHGESIFADLCYGKKKIQIWISKESYNKNRIKKGDILKVTGRIDFTNTGEKTIFVENYRVLVRPYNYSENAYKELGQLLLYRNNVEKTIEKVFEKHGALRVRTHTLIKYRENPNINLFETIRKDKKLYLKFTHEIELKKIVAYTLLPIYEIGNVFRNMGESKKHLIEFTMAEAYFPFRNLAFGIEIIKEIFNELTDSDMFIPFFTYDDLTNINLNKYKVYFLGFPREGNFPLTKKDEKGRFLDVKLFYKGLSVAHICEENNDLEEVKRALEKQWENMNDKDIDLSFIKSMEHGMPPMVGMAFCIDRFISVHKNIKIREAFELP